MKNGLLFGMTIIAGAFAYAYIKTGAFKTRAAQPIDATPLLGPGWEATPDGGYINTGYNFGAGIGAYLH